MREEQPEARAMLPVTVPWTLLQGIALVQLYTEERWVEPQRMDKYPYSLLYHQTMRLSPPAARLHPPRLLQRCCR